MTRGDDIVQVLFKTNDHLPRRDRRARAVDFTIAARRAERKNDRRAAIENYEKAARELRSSSNDRAHEAALLMDAEIYRLRNGG